MANLIEQIGADYFHRRFQGAFFRDPDSFPSVMHGMSGRGDIEYSRVLGTPDRVANEVRHLSFDFFDSLEKFSVPPLGWRSGYAGKLLVHMQRNNSSYNHRGVGANNIQSHFAPLTTELADEGMVNTSLSYAQLCSLVFSDDFLPLQQGVEEIREGQRLGFAVSPTVAISVKNEEVLEVYFRQYAVGTIDGANRMKISVPHIREYLGELR